MRKILTYTALLLAFTNHGKALDIPSEKSQDLIERCPKIRLAGGEWLSWKHLMLTPSGTGNSLRLMELINKHLPAKIEDLGTTPLTRQLYQLKEGEIDSIFGLFPLDDRLVNYEFTDSYFLEPLFIYAHESNAGKLTKTTDLNNFKGVFVRGSNYGKEVNKIIKENPGNWIAVNKHIQAVGMVAAGRADFYIGSYVSEDLKEFNSQLNRSEYPIAFQEVGAAFSKKTDCKLWIPYINQLIQDNLQPYMTHKF